MTFEEAKALLRPWIIVGRSDKQYGPHALLGDGNGVAYITYLPFSSNKGWVKMYSEPRVEGYGLRGGPPPKIVKAAKIYAGYFRGPE